MVFKGIIRGLKWFIGQIAFKESRFRNAFRNFRSNMLSLSQVVFLAPLILPTIPAPNHQNVLPRFLKEALKGCRHNICLVVSPVVNLYQI